MFQWNRIYFPQKTIESQPSLPTNETRNIITWALLIMSEKLNILQRAFHLIGFWKYLVLFATFVVSCTALGMSSDTLNASFIRNVLRVFIYPLQSGIIIVCIMAPKRKTNASDEPLIRRKAKRPWKRRSICNLRQLWTEPLSCCSEILRSITQLITRARICRYL